jgi:DnaJ like chaperone protein
MNVWGKIIGAFIGLLFGGLGGALFGAFLGHAVDSVAPRVGVINLAAAQQAFFKALFSTMGHLAKADGRVSEREIAVAQEIMSRMQLSAHQRRLAIELFNQGKQPGFALAPTIQAFYQVCGSQPNLLRMFVEILLDAALADGKLDTAAVAVMLSICNHLGISQAEFEQMVNMRHNAAGYRRQARQPQRANSDPYQVLGIVPGASDREVKQAYRRLISQHHPDKLVSKGLPKEMMDLAKDKTAETTAAYDDIRKRRDMR